MKGRQADGVRTIAILEQIEEWLALNAALRAAEHRLFELHCRRGSDCQTTDQLVEGTRDRPNKPSDDCAVAQCEQLRTRLLNLSRKLAASCARVDPESTICALLLQAVDEVLRDGVVDPSTEQQIERWIA